jgi:superfamily II DNA or RNA helicase
MYLNSRGCVIPKDSIDKDELNRIRSELTVIPKENHAMKIAQQQEKQIVVFRENEQKIYIPRFYGIENYGDPETIDIPCGDNIIVPFVNELRDYQKEIVGIYLNHVQSGYGGGILEVPCGRGKTIMALNILSKLQKKTLIIVHKEFLMNQWIERISDFVPSARVGKIQGKTFDIENKDIVIGMIQTMYDKPYPVNMFASFGLTILDEVHRVGSEEFSKTLLRVVTPYMLGISATVDRKDGLTELLYMFIGPKIYSEVRKERDGVEVRALQYNNDHEEYTKEEFDYRGNIQYSTMINKISAFPLRRMYIVRVLQDLISENNNKQIMVLSHKRDLLDYLEGEISRIEFATCGQYVGGMKQTALQTSETKQIVLATYAMAAEALDIKTLNTLVMVSPKTDIVQSVGRILRTRGDGKIIVDIVDSHDVFQNQWKNRRAFYKKSEYCIKMISSGEYTDMTNVESWKVVFDPSTKKGKKKECDDMPKCLLDI